MKEGLPLLDSHQNRVCYLEDDWGSIGWIRSCKGSLQEVALQEAMEGEKEKKRREREAFLLPWPVEMRS